MVLFIVSRHGKWYVRRTREYISVQMDREHACNACTGVPWTDRSRFVLKQYMIRNSLSWYHNTNTVGTILPRTPCSVPRHYYVPTHRLGLFHDRDTDNPTFTYLCICYLNKKTMEKSPTPEINPVHVYWEEFILGLQEFYESLDRYNENPNRTIQ